MNKKLLILILSFFVLSINLKSYSNSYITEEIVKGCEPFEIKSNKSKKAFLLLHGLGGCPHEVSLVGEYLSNNGYNVFAPRYPGHGAKGKVMSNYGWQDWYNIAENQYLDLIKKYDEVYVLGFSTGGTLTLKLAEKYNIKKIVLLSPFIYIAYKWFYIFRPETYLTTVASFIDDWPANLTLVHINDPIARKNYIRGDYFSFKATRSALELIQETKKDLSKIKSDVLIIHSKGDETTDYSGSEYLYKNIGSTNKKLITLKKSNHIIGLDYEKNKVFREIKYFINSNN
ncbi:MAG: alpha/beta fold hydrolase [Candidatus Sericytochromatia bacterium]